MGHKQNDSTLSNGSNTSQSSQSSNPWGGVLKNKLSFRNQPVSAQKNTSKNPYGYIQKSQKKKSSKSTEDEKIETKETEKRPKRPKSLKQRKNKSDSLSKSSPNTPIINEQQQKQQNEEQNRKKKRKLRRQLSLAKMEMSVLKARLGLEQMQTPTIINENDAQSVCSDDISVASLPSMNGHQSHHRVGYHSPAASVTSENLFATIESMGSFEDDIKSIIDKVDTLQKQVEDKNDENIIKENKQLKQELDRIKAKLQSVENENKKLKAQKQSDTKKKSEVVKKAVVEFKPNPFEKYDRLKDLGQSVDSIVAKMQKAGIQTKQIEEWRKKNKSQAADQRMASNVNAKEQLYVKYDKMKKMQMPNDTIRNRMKMDGMKEDEIEKYLNPTAIQTNQNKEEDEFKQKMVKYDRMKKIGMPEQTIRNKMTLDGISANDQDRYFNPEKFKENKPNPALAKYERMKKMGMPTHAIVNKMRLDGISSSDIAEFENPGANKKKKKKVKEKDPRFAKYDKMKKMGMPNHAIVNKMYLMV